MTTIKTAISIPEPLFEAVGSLSRELGVPRSQVFAMAVKEFLSKTENRRLFKKLNQAWKVLLRFYRRLAKFEHYFLVISRKFFRISFPAFVSIDSG